jgi:hypothetical protein
METEEAELTGPAEELVAESGIQLNSRNAELGKSRWGRHWKTCCGNVSQGRN